MLINRSGALSAALLASTITVSTGTGTGTAHADVGRDQPRAVGSSVTSTPPYDQVWTRSEHELAKAEMDAEEGTVKITLTSSCTEAGANAALVFCTDGGTFRHAEAYTGFGYRRLPPESDKVRVKATFTDVAVVKDTHPVGRYAKVRPYTVMYVNGNPTYCFAQQVDQVGGDLLGNHGGWVPGDSLGGTRWESDCVVEGLSKTQPSGVYAILSSWLTDPMSDGQEHHVEVRGKIATLSVVPEPVA